MEPKTTLEDLIKNSDKGNVQENLKSLIQALKQQEDDKLNSFQDVLSGIVSSQKGLSESIGKMADTLEKILNRPDPELPAYPEPKDFPEIQKVSMEKPDWYKDYDWDAMYANWTKMLIAAFRPILDALEEKVGNELMATRDILNDILNKDASVVIKAPKEKAAMNLGSIRRKSRWEVISTIKGGITGAFDGSNTLFYLPAAPIPNSEQVRLNQGMPLANGEDYTLSGNKISFVLPPNAGSTCEIRYQT